MKKIHSTYVFFLAVFIILTLNYHTIAFASGDVPQKVLDDRDSVVKVQCQTSKGTEFGSGFAIGKSSPVSFIVTNLHVVKDNVGGIYILRKNNQEIKAKIFVQLPYTDVCVLSLEEPIYDIPPLVIYDKKIVDVGTAVYALGFPGAADALSDKSTGDSNDVTITDGIISAQKSLTLQEPGAPVKILQINVAINSGNSGGPLVNKYGQVVGINTYSVTQSQNINGSISIMELVDTLNQEGIPYQSSSDGTPLISSKTIEYISLVAVALAVVTTIIILAKRNRLKKQKTLHEFVAQWGGKLPFEMAARILAPIIKEMAELHAKGFSNADIAPDTILISNDKIQANLHRHDRFNKKNMPLHPGFSAPELYSTDVKIGPWSDVYSLSAVLFFMLTGKKPLGVLERLAEGKSVAIEFEDAYVDQKQCEVIRAGLAMDILKRPQNATELLLALGFTEDDIPVAASPLKQTVEKKRKAPVGIIVTASVVLLLGIGGLGYYLYITSIYNDALDKIQKQDYTDAIKDLSKTPRFFRDSPKYMSFACAGKNMQNNEFDAAKQEFIKLDTFLNANTMLQEVDYQKANYLLDQGDFDGAKNIFIALGSYKNSIDMIVEVDYQRAFLAMNNNDFDTANTLLQKLAQKNYKDSKLLILDLTYNQALTLYNQKNYEEAYKLLDKINPYQDSQSYLQILTEDLYQEGIELYRSGSFSTAEERFAFVKPYQYSNEYILLCEVHQKSINDSLTKYNEMVDLFNSLKSMLSFEDAQKLYESNLFLLYRIAGVWIDNKDGIGLSIYYDGTNWMMSLVDVHSKKPYDFKIDRSSIIFGQDAYISFRPKTASSMVVTFEGLKPLNMVRYK